MTNRALFLLACVIVLGCQGTGPPIDQVKWSRYSTDDHAVAELPTSPSGCSNGIVIRFSENPVTPGYVPTSKLGPYASYDYSATVLSTVRHPITVRWWGTSCHADGKTEHHLFSPAEFSEAFECAEAVLLPDTRYQCDRASEIGGMLSGEKVTWCVAGYDQNGVEYRTESTVAADDLAVLQRRLSPPR